MRRDGVLLGVIPDYTWSGRGFRVDEVVEGEPADGAGMEDGDVIVVMKGVQVTDIYDYMRALNRVEEGETVELQILRDGELIRLDVQF
jgi:S1-C subfamily serine protease